MCTHVHMHTYKSIEHFMHMNNMCVNLWSFIFTKNCLMSPVCTDIRPCFRKRVFHLHGLLSPSCFFSQIKKPWIYNPFFPLHHLSWGKAKPPQHAWRTTTPTALVCRCLWAARLSPRWLPVDARVFLHRTSLCTSREEMLVKRHMQTASMGHATSGSNNAL